MDAQPKRRTHGRLSLRPLPAGRCKVIALDSYRRRALESHGDAPLNLEWDRLARLAEEAWCWRDPESLAELGAVVARLGIRSLEDWGV
jgi:hypothetical protein